MYDKCYENPEYIYVFFKFFQKSCIELVHFKVKRNPPLQRRKKIIACVCECITRRNHHQQNPSSKGTDFSISHHVCHTSTIQSHSIVPDHIYIYICVVVLNSFQIPSASHKLQLNRLCHLFSTQTYANTHKHHIDLNPWKKAIQV